MPLCKSAYIKAENYVVRVHLQDLGDTTVLSPTCLIISFSLTLPPSLSLSLPLPTHSWSPLPHAHAHTQYIRWQSAIDEFWMVRGPRGNNQVPLPRSQILAFILKLSSEVLRELITLSLFMSSYLVCNCSSMSTFSINHSCHDDIGERLWKL